MRIREAACDDAPAIARVHVESWRTTYRGIVPDAVLDGLSAAQRQPMWERQLCAGAGTRCIYVAEDTDGRVVGFASGGRPQEEVPGFDGELYTVYLLQPAQGQGTGRRLVGEVARCLYGRGFGSMLLWVLAENQPARRFYERLGGRVVAGKPIEIGATLEEVAYGWDDLAVLLRQLQDQEGPA